MSYKYTVEVWEPLPSDQIKEGNPQITHHVTQQETFWKLIDAWNWVLDNKIEKYTVYKGECIIDNS